MYAPSTNARKGAAAPLPLVDVNSRFRPYDRGLSPDRRPARRPTKKRAPVPKVRTGPSPNDEHDIVYFRRHRDDDADQAFPGQAFLNDVCPTKVRATMRAVLVAVASAPPKRFAGGGYWEAMKGDMTGWFEVRVDGRQRHHYRLFCRLDYEAKKRDKPLLVVITGLDKPFRTELKKADYAAVRALGDEYFKRNPRSIA